MSLIDWDILGSVRYIPPGGSEKSTALDLNPAKKVLADLNQLRQQQQTQAIIIKQKEKASQTLPGKITQNILETASMQQSLKAAGQPLLTTEQATASKLQGTGVKTTTSSGIPIVTTTDPNLLDLLRTQQAQIEELKYRDLASQTKEIHTATKEVFTTYEKQIIAPPEYEGKGGTDWGMIALLAAGIFGAAIIGSAVLRR